MLIQSRTFIVAALGWMMVHAMTLTRVSAHPGHDVKKPATANRRSATSTTARTWSDATATVDERGSFVMAKDGIVQIRRGDDTLINLPLITLNQVDQDFVAERLASLRSELEDSLLVAQTTRKEQAVAAQGAPLIAAHFDPFVKLMAIRTRWNDHFFFVESNGIPNHPLMIGITAWQQQVPLPQKYVGDNAWRIPLHPVPAKNPASTKNRFLRGAIAVAVNGIPIFNPLNNRGDDAYLFGELDEYGGHCGRADDYHYHLAPVHLNKVVGEDQPIAYALDGYPIYGYQTEKSSDSAPLDKLNGHKDKDGHYHYHATKTYPYLNGGFYGEVVEKEGQVDPQPRAEPLRPSLPPLRDAKIVDFRETKPGSNLLTYDVKGKKGTVAYTLNENGSATFEFTDTNGRKTVENYVARKRNPKDPPAGGDSAPPPPRGERPQRKAEQPPKRDATTNDSNRGAAKLEVSSTSVDAKGRLSIDCTCDGKGQSPSVSWKNAPPGTKAYALSLWHTAPDREKSYWLVYNIPANVTQIAQNTPPEGLVGMNDRREAQFDPMCSKGPGVKTYHVTVYALSRSVELAPKRATRESLLDAIKSITLAEGTLDFEYERKGK